jgi:type III secretion system (T3SS) inner membrane Yop/YscD-like protein
VSVIEVRGRGGQYLGRLSTDRREVSIGRAFSNDLILDDPYVSPHHLRLVAVDGGWEAHDLGSLNGFRHKGAGGGTDTLVRSGDTLRIGHTVLRIYSDDHPVPPAMRLGGWEDRMSLLGRHRIWPALAGLTVLLAAISAYRTSWVELEPQSFLEPIVTNLSGPLLFALLWALLGRLLRHRAHLLAHFGIWLSIGLLSRVTTSAAALAGYNASSATVESVLDQGAFSLLLLCGLSCSLLLATNLRARGRWICSLGVAAAFVLVTVIAQYQMHEQFRPVPRYYSRLASRVWLWARPVQEEHLLERLPRLAERADEAIIDDGSHGPKAAAPPPAAEEKDGVTAR